MSKIFGEKFYPESSSELLAVENNRDSDIIKENINRGYQMAKKTAAWDAKNAGLKSLKLAMEYTGLSRQTFQGWHERKPRLFMAVVIGVKHILAAQEKKVCPVCGEEESK